MKIRSTFLFGLVFLLTVTACQNQHKNPLTDLREESIHSLNMFLYPSTIRMINLGGDSAFYQATKGIKELQYLTINLADSSTAEIYAEWEAAQDFEDWEELISAKIDGNSSIVYAPKNSQDKFFASMRTNNGVNLLWAEGSINLNQAMKVMDGGMDLGPITDYLNNNKKDKQRSEVWKKAREEQRRLEAADSTTFEKIID
jgi:hypothetical protein